MDPQVDDAFWVDRCWPAADVTPREMRILKERSTRTLDEIGKGLEKPLTRERVRQLESAARKKLRVAAEEVAPGASDAFRSQLHSAACLDVQDLLELLPSKDPGRSKVLAETLGANPVRVWNTQVPGLWTDRGHRLESALKRIAREAPFHHRDLEDLAQGERLPQSLDVAALLGHPDASVERKGDWWVRKTARVRDALYLFLSDVGEPQSLERLSAVVSLNEHATREQLRRDNRFVMTRPARLWTLREWNQVEEHGPRSASDAVYLVLSSHGPMTRSELVKVMRDYYPVGLWRINQVLGSSRFGELPDGRVGLVADGAVQAGVQEPKRPPTVMESPDGEIVAYRQPVTPDVLRGSGIGVPRFLVWRLGVREIPGSLVFTDAESGEEVILRRSTSASTVSSLRRYAVQLRAVDGCVLGLLFRIRDRTIRVTHGCTSEACPAGAV